MKSASGRKRRSSQHNKDVSVANKQRKKRATLVGVSSAVMFFALFATTSMVSLFASSGEVAANTCSINPSLCDVPEISALEGTAALAVIAAMLLLAWERRRQA